MVLRRETIMREKRTIKRKAIINLLHDLGQLTVLLGQFLWKVRALDEMSLSKNGILGKIPL